MMIDHFYLTENSVYIDYYRRASLPNRALEMVQCYLCIPNQEYVQLNASMVISIELFVKYKQTNVYL